MAYKFIASNAYFVYQIATPLINKFYLCESLNNYGNFFIPQTARHACSDWLREGVTSLHNTTNSVLQDACTDISLWWKGGEFKNHNCKLIYVYLLSTNSRIKSQSIDFAIMISIIYFYKIVTEIHF